MEIKFCSLEDNQKLGEFLNQKLLFSKSSLKNYVPKKYLEKNIRLKDEISLPMNLMNMHFINPDYIGAELEIIYEDEDLIVVNKPEFVHGHCLLYEENTTVLNFLRSKYNLPFLANALSSNQERGLLYRLDSTTSGVLIFVKDQEYHKELRSNFSSIAHSKEYLAIVEGKINIDELCTHYLGGSESKGHKITQVSGGVECRAHYKTVKFIGESTLILVKLETGFRHQIRAQLSLMGHPILGDELYGAKVGQKRIYLHALNYEIQLKGRVQKFSASYNKLFCDFLNTDSLLKVLT